MFKIFGAILLSFVMLLTVAPTASAASAPSAFISGSLYTDTLPTKVSFARYGQGNRSRVLCVGVRTGAGHTRSIDIWNGRYKVVSNYRQRANRTVGCTGHQFYATSRYVHVRVTEDVPGPFNFTSNKYIRIW